jgi:hypothetical protein
MNQYKTNPFFQRISDEPNRCDLPPLERFMQSMNIGYIEWHDGIGYALSALSELNQDELQTVESLLIERKDQDWRDVEALAALATPAAIQALKECLQSTNLEGRLFAVKFLKDMRIEDRVEEILLDTLPQTAIGNGLTYALSIIEQYPTERLKQKLLWCCMNGNEDIRVHCAALALYLYGIASTSFDVSHKIVFEFKEANPEKRRVSFNKLCQIIGINPEGLGC